MIPGEAMWTEDAKGGRPAAAPPPGRGRSLRGETANGGRRSMDRSANDDDDGSVRGRQRRSRVVKEQKASDRDSRKGGGGGGGGGGVVGWILSLLDWMTSLRGGEGSNGRIGLLNWENDVWPPEDGRLPSSSTTRHVLLVDPPDPSPLVLSFRIVYLQLSAQQRRAQAPALLLLLPSTYATSSATRCPCAAPSSSPSSTSTSSTRRPALLLLPPLLLPCSCSNSVKEAGPPPL